MFARHLHPNLDVRHVVLIEHDVVTTGPKVAVAEERPDIVQQRLPQHRELVPGGSRRYNGCWTLDRTCQLHVVSHQALAYHTASRVIIRRGRAAAAALDQ